MLRKSRRRSERVLTRWPAFVLHYSGPLAAEITDVNEHGLFVHTPLVRDVGQLVRLQVALPDGPIVLVGRVRFCGASIAGHGLGVELVDLHAYERARWQRAYYTLLPDSRDHVLLATAA